RTFAIDRLSIADFARTAANGGVYERNAVHRLRESRALIAYDGLRNCSDYTLLDDQWQRNLSVLSDWAKSLPALQDSLVRGDQTDREAKLLLALVDNAESKELASKALRADTKTVNSIHWFSQFKNEHYTSITLSPDLLPAYYWAITVLAPIAELEHTVEVEK